MKILNHASLPAKWAFILPLVFLTAFAYIPLRSQDLVKEVPLPSISVEKLGEFKKTIEIAKDSLQKRNLREFYKTAGVFFQERQDLRLEEKRFEAKTREEAIALEWLYYLVITAPMIPVEEYVQIENDFLHTDINTKMKVIEMIATSRLGNPISRQRSKLTYQRAYGIEYQEIFTESERRQLEIAHIAYHAALIKSFFPVYEAAQSAKAELHFIATPGYAPPPPPPMPYPASSEKGRELRKKYEEERQKHIDPAFLLFSKIDKRLLSIISLMNPNQKNVKTRFVRAVVNCFPRDGVSVQEYIRKAGFSSNEECALALEDVYPRTTETTYLFQGLPDEAEVAEYREVKAKAEEEKLRLAYERRNKAKEDERKAGRRISILSIKLSEEILEEDIKVLSDPKVKKEKEEALKSFRTRRERYEKELAEDVLKDTVEERIRKKKAEIVLFTEAENQAQKEIEKTTILRHRENKKKLWQLIVQEKAKLEAELVKEISKEGKK